MNPNSRPPRLKIPRHEPDVMESLDEQNLVLKEEIRTEQHEIDGKLVSIKIIPMGYSGRIKKSVWKRLRRERFERSKPA